MDFHTKSFFLLICLLLSLFSNKAFQSTAIPASTIGTKEMLQQPTKPIMTENVLSNGKTKVENLPEMSDVDNNRGGFLDIIAAIFRPTTSTSSPIVSTTQPLIPQRECPQCTCGQVNTIKRIVGGQETMIHQYPWMALLLQSGRFYCGASLINDLYVATAAHCVRGFVPLTITVRLLEHNRMNSSSNVIDRSVLWVRINENYNSRTYDNDIALIRMSEAVEFNNLLRPVCMPEEGNSFAGDTAIVTGWGTLSEGGATSDTLQEVEVPVLSEMECKESKYGSSQITANMLCAGYKEGGKDSCQGDSGGPLHVAFDNSSQYQLAGIVSWGEGCARPDAPGVYARVNRYLSWIRMNTIDACGCGMESENPETTTVAGEVVT